MLTVSDPVTWRPRRVTVAGIPGSGKTTLSLRLNAELGLPFVEMDALFIGAGWRPRPEFEADVDAHIARDSWVIEWQYPTVRDRIAATADTLIWLDVPASKAVFQLIWRTVRRRLSGEELWNGNRELPLLRVFIDKDHIFRWTIRTRNKFRVLVPDTERKYKHLHVVRLRNYDEVERWVKSAVEATTQV